MSPLTKEGIARSLRNRLLEFFRRYQLSDQTFLIIVAVLVGFLGGLGAIFFEWMIEFGQHFFFGIFPKLVGNPKWLVIIIPAFGAFFLAPLIYYFPVEAKSDGVPATMHAVALKGGMIAWWRNDLPVVAEAGAAEPQTPEPQTPEPQTPEPQTP